MVINIIAKNIYHFTYYFLADQRYVITSILFLECQVPVDITKYLISSFSTWHGTRYAKGHYQYIATKQLHAALNGTANML